MIKDDHLDPELLATLAEGNQELMDPGHWDHLSRCDSCYAAFSEAVRDAQQWALAEGELDCPPELIAAGKSLAGGERETTTGRTGAGRWFRTAPVLVGALILLFFLLRPIFQDAEPSDPRFEPIRLALAQGGDEALLLPGVASAVPAGEIPFRGTGSDMELAALVDQLSRLHTENRGDSESAYWLAAGRLAQNRLEQAAVLALQVRQDYPESAPIRILSGVIDYRRSDLAGAETHFRSAIRHDDDSAEAHYNLGRLLLETDRPEEGVARLEQALDLAPASTAGRRASELLNSRH